MLKGKKTYAVAGLSIVGALLAVMSGQATPAEAAQLIVTAALGATLRNGITTEGEKSGS